MDSATKGMGYLIYERGRKLNSKRNLAPSSFETFPYKYTYRTGISSP